MGFCGFCEEELWVLVGCVVGSGEVVYVVWSWSGGFGGCGVVVEVVVWWVEVLRCCC